ncbi:hypothetical protein [Streptomyces sp. NPDC048508]|uniref:hypothetical protein n=1 Tax=Streptomyces sp. NPDC048508 TaxID=3365561 RepID=UPI00371DFA93
MALGDGVRAGVNPFLGGDEESGRVTRYGLAALGGGEPQVASGLPNVSGTKLAFGLGLALCFPDCQVVVPKIQVASGAESLLPSPSLGRGPAS